MKREIFRFILGLSVGLFGFCCPLYYCVYVTSCIVSRCYLNLKSNVSFAYTGYLVRFKAQYVTFKVLRIHWLSL